jgi:glycosyltransferase involved in cell wall biosynthesis
LPEVVGDAGVYFDPTDVRSIAAAIGSLLNDQEYRELLAGRATRQAALFTWDASARALLTCFDELVHEANGQSTVARSA